MCYGDKEGDFMEFVAFYLGDINIYWYGLIIVFALLIGLGISKIMFKLYGEKFSPMWDLLIFIIPVSLICARIFYVIIHLYNYPYIYCHSYQCTISAPASYSYYLADCGLYYCLCLYTRVHHQVSS